MFKSILVDKKVCPCVYRNIGLLFATLLLIWGLSGCSSLSSVRSAKIGEGELSRQEIEKFEQDNILDSEEEITPKDYLAKLENEKKVESGKTKSNKSLLPPLNRQLERLHKEQKKIKQDVDGLKSDVSDIKKTLLEIKSSIEDIPSKSKIAQKGPSSISPKTSSAQQYIISSDESIARNSLNKKEKLSNNKKNNKTNFTPVSLKSEALQKSIDFSRAEDFLEKKDYHKAIIEMKKLENSLKSEVEKTEYNFILGNSNYGLRQYAKAIEYFVKVLSSPGFAKKDKVHIMLADSHIRTGSPTKAVDVYRDLIAKHPKSNYLPKARKMLQQL